MAIRFWSQRQKAVLYNIFDQVRLYEYGFLENLFVKDIFGQKLTLKCYRRIEKEWEIYWEEAFGEQPEDKFKLLVVRVNDNTLLLLKAHRAASVAKVLGELYPKLSSKEDYVEEYSED